MIKKNQFNINDIDIKLVGFKSFLGREGHGLNATIVYKGKKIIFAMDDASGGEMRIDTLGERGTPAYEANRKISDELEQEIAKLPLDTRYGFDSPQTLETVISHLADEKDLMKKVKRLSKKAIVIKEGDEIITVSWKRPLGEIVKVPAGKDAIQKVYDRESTKEGQTILNSDQLESLGINIKKQQ